MIDTRLCFKTATELADLVQRRDISCVEVWEAHHAHIEATNPLVNAIVTLVPDFAREQALAIDIRIGKGESVGPLAGLPIAHKDVFQTRGIRTTFGSRRFAAHVPAEDALIIERLREAGAITIGKTNTPEWGAGSQTFNAVFGATCNPFDTGKTCGGSSGGAATALSSRLVPLADGSDMGGSLRNPASFCNVVGFRPSPGRVPSYPNPLAWSPLGVLGPMARTVSDCALMLSAIAGPDARSPIAIDEPGSTFRGIPSRSFGGTRVAISPDFGGQLPVDPVVARVIHSATSVLESLGCKAEADCPDFAGADQVFKTLRAFNFAAAHGEAIKQYPELYKDSIIWNVNQGLALTGSDVAKAEQERTRIYHHVREFMEVYEYMLLPVAQVPPFAIETEWVTHINGIEMETYIDWMKSCYYISILGLPCISVPCGFTDDGLPVGIQIVGRHHCDLGVLQLAKAFETARPLYDVLPGICQVPPQ